MRRGIKLLEEARAQLGDEVGLLHDMHERYLPNQAVEFAKQVKSWACSSSKIRCRRKTSTTSA